MSKTFLSYPVYLVFLSGSESSFSVLTMAGGIEEQSNENTPDGNKQAKIEMARSGIEKFFSYFTFKLIFSV